MSTPAYLRTPEVRQLLGLNKMAMSRLIRSGAITTFKPPGSETLVPAEEVDRIKRLYTRPATR